MDARDVIAEALRRPLYNSDHNERSDDELGALADIALAALAADGYVIVRREREMAQKLVVMQIPSEARGEWLINERLADASIGGWRVVQMTDHNGMLVCLMELPVIVRREQVGIIEKVSEAFITVLRKRDLTFKPEYDAPVYVDVIEEDA